MTSETVLQLRIYAMSYSVECRPHLWKAPNEKVFICQAIKLMKGGTLLSDMKDALTRRLPAGAWRRRGRRQPRGAAGPLAVAAGGGASEQVSGAVKS